MFNGWKLCIVSFYSRMKKRKADPILNSNDMIMVRNFEEKLYIMM